MPVCIAASIAMIEANLIAGTTGNTPNSFVNMETLRFPLGVLSGMGFIGAGVILRQRDIVVGVTTHVVRAAGCSKFRVCKVKLRMATRVLAPSIPSEGLDQSTGAAGRAHLEWQPRQESGIAAAARCSRETYP